jgi:hypothetical protein
MISCRAATAIQLIGVRNADTLQKSGVLQYTQHRYARSWRTRIAVLDLRIQSARISRSKINATEVRMVEFRRR